MEDVITVKFILLLLTRIAAENNKRCTLGSGNTVQLLHIL